MITFHSPPHTWNPWVITTTRRVMNSSPTRVVKLFTTKSCTNLVDCTFNHPPFARQLPWRYFLQGHQMMSFKLVKQSLTNHGKGQAPPPAYHVSDRRVSRWFFSKKTSRIFWAGFPRFLTCCMLRCFNSTCFKPRKTHLPKPGKNSPTKSGWKPAWSLHNNNQTQGTGTKSCRDSQHEIGFFEVSVVFFCE